MSTPHSLPLTEMFVGHQGEGASVGKLLFFVRLAGCNLMCTWCDSKHAWKGGKFTSLLEVAKAFQASRAHGLCITGGCPLLHQTEVKELISLCGFPYTEIETNGTIAPTPELMAIVTQFNVSPKLSNSGNPVVSRYRPEVLRLYSQVTFPNSIFKFVVGGKEMLKEVVSLCTECSIPFSRVYLMPEGSTRVLQNKRMKAIQQLALAHGFNFSPRLHVLIYDKKRRV